MSGVWCLCVGQCIVDGAFVFRSNMFSCCAFAFISMSRVQVVVLFALLHSHLYINRLPLQSLCPLNSTRTWMEYHTLEVKSQGDTWSTCT